MARWTFTEKNTPAVTYVMHVNPNEGGTPEPSKNFSIQQTVGPHRRGVMQEGEMQPIAINFGGVILEQAHLEAMEEWTDKRVLLELVDDLGRTFVGAIGSFSPTREFRPNRPWFHRYQATFQVIAYKDANGNSRYGKYF